MIIGINGKVGAGKDTVGQLIQKLTVPPGIQTLTEGPESPWKVKKFAAKLKQIASILTGIPAEKFEDQEFKKTFLPEEWTCFALTVFNSDAGKQQTFRFTSELAAQQFIEACSEDFDPEKPKYPPIEERRLTVREFLQKLGTDAIRDNIHTNTWVNALFAEYNSEGYWPEAAWEDRIPKWLVTDCRFPNEAQAIKDRQGLVIQVKRPGDNIGDLHPSETALDNWSFDYIIENNGTLEDLEVKVKEFLQKFNIA